MDQTREMVLLAVLIAAIAIAVSLALPGHAERAEAPLDPGSICFGDR